MVIYYGRIRNSHQQNKSKIRRFLRTLELLSLSYRQNLGPPGLKVQLLVSYMNKQNPKIQWAFGDDSPRLAKLGVWLYFPICKDVFFRIGLNSFFSRKKGEVKRSASKPWKNTRQPCRSGNEELFFFFFFAWPCPLEVGGFDQRNSEKPRL